MQPTTIQDDERRPSILTVDDMPSILQLLQLTLSGDYDVTTAESGVEALTLLKRESFDLILLDVMMPVMDGLETLRQLRQLPLAQNTPVIFLTAVDELMSEQTALQLGADDYIVKPFKPSLVQLRIGNLLQRTRLQQELEMALVDQGLWTWNLRTDKLLIDTRHSEQFAPLPNDPGIANLNWADYCHPEDLPAIDKAREAYLSGRESTFKADVRFRKRNGEWNWVNIYGQASKTSHDFGVVQLKGTYRDIEQRKASEEALRKSEERLRFVMNATGEGIWDWQIQSEQVTHNASWCTILGLDPENLQHPISLWNTLIHPEDRPQVENAMLAAVDRDIPFRQEYRLHHANGNYVWVLDIGKVVERTTNGVALRMVGAIKDITQRKQTEVEFKRMALIDTLTGLPNRRLLFDRLRQAISQNRRYKSFGALLFIDLDHFKAVNDTLGHDFGDMILVEVGRRLTANTRETDTAARLGGDEFVVMLTELGEHRETALESALKLANKIFEALNQPHDLGTECRQCSPSIGLMLFSDEDESPDALLKAADIAMYRAKSSGRNRIQVFE